MSIRIGQYTGVLKIGAPLTNLAEEKRVRIIWKQRQEVGK